MIMFKQILNFILGLLVPLYGIISFIWKNIFWLFLIVGAVIFVIYIKDLKIDYLKTQTLLQAQEQLIATQNQALIDLQKQNILIIQNQNKLTELESAANNLAQKQSNITDIIKNVPIAPETCHPFDDKGLTTRFDLFRAFQNSEYGATP